MSVSARAEAGASRGTGEGRAAPGLLPHDCSALARPSSIPSTHRAGPARRRTELEASGARRVHDGTAVTRKGQVTIPKTIRQKLGLRQGSRVEFVMAGDRMVNPGRRTRRIEEKERFVRNSCHDRYTAR